uniref:Small ribosomal subunit protein eS17 n=1 Tax=Salmo salar TaxID=8030 RepID=B5X9R2_SALSA|nr:40S ribosomal protein S17-A [Salmo salar]ACI67582.1 40S ribosomal protein S17-A [Salmo salar]
MGGYVRTKTVKRASKAIIEKNYPILSLDFHENKRICAQVAIIPSKRLRNKIAGYTTHLMKRIQKGPVRGISIKLQEEERERRDNYVPSESVLCGRDNMTKETCQMIRELGFTKTANKWGEFMVKESTL